MQNSKLCLPISLFIFIILCIAQPLHAQKMEKNNAEKKLPQVWLQFNPLNLFEPDILIACTGLYKKNNRWGFALDAGIYVAWQNYASVVKPQGGLRLKPEVKYYVDHSKNQKSALYVSFQGLIKITNTKFEEFLAINDAAGQPLFSQLAKYTERKTVLGGSLNLGGEFVLDNAERLMIEPYIGVGVRRKMFKALNLPNGANINYDFNSRSGRVFNILYNGNFPSLLAGFKISYRIK